MRKKGKQAVFHTVEVVVLILLTCIVSVSMGYYLGNHSVYDSNSAQIDDKYVNNFLDNYQYILENYYGEVDSETLMNGALDGMLAALGDDYSSIVNSNSFDIYLEGNYQGIGIEIYNDGNNVIILDVFENSSASQAGLQVGDIILSIDGVDYSQQEVSAITDYIKNSKSDTFTFEIMRQDEKHTFTLKRSNVTIQSVQSKIFEKNGKKIGYISLDVFATATAEQFSSTLETLEKDGIDSLIIDVRDNSGGHLTTVVDILSNFLDSKNVIYQTETKEEVKKFYSKGSITKEYPIVVLQNASSASASELLSIALQEQYGATVIGETSYGKGTVQELVTTGGTEYKFTTKKWLSPKGNWIHEKGVTPDISVSLDSSYYDNPIEDNDKQLQKALEELAK